NWTLQRGTTHQLPAAGAAAGKPLGCHVWGACDELWDPSEKRSITTALDMKNSFLHRPEGCKRRADRDDRVRSHRSRSRATNEGAPSGWSSPVRRKLRIPSRSETGQRTWCENKTLRPTASTAISGWANLSGVGERRETRNFSGRPANGRLHAVKTRCY